MHSWHPWPPQTSAGLCDTGGSTDSFHLRLSVTVARHPTSSLLQMPPLPQSGSADPAAVPASIWLVQEVCAGLAFPAIVSSLAVCESAGQCPKQTNSALSALTNTTHLHLGKLCSPSSPSARTREAVSEGAWGSVLTTCRLNG